MTYFIGLDVGTSGAKALLVNETGRVVESATEEYPMSTPKPLWAEQDPEHWWQASAAALRHIVTSAGISPQEIKGIGLTGQMHGLVLLGNDGRVLRPCIMWNDQRTAAQCESITRSIGASRLLELTGNPVLPGFTAPKILWVREHEPGVYKRVAHVLLPKDYIRFRLTGGFVTEVSDASGTSLLDVRNRRWSEEMMDRLELRKEWLPSVVESPARTGEVTRESSAMTGVKAGTPVFGGGGDQAAGAVGSGIVRPGVISITIGTSGVVFAASDAYAYEPEGRLHAFCHAVPGAWHLMGVTLSAGGSLRWFRDRFCEREREEAKAQGRDAYEIMMKTAESAPPGSGGLLFLPYLTGERTPYPDPTARGVFLGITVRHEKSHFIRSILEGVAFSLRDCLELVKGLNLPLTEIRVSGGGARSALWRQILADILGHDLVTVTSTEGAPYGAALLAAVGSGGFSTVGEACDAWIKISSRTRHDPSHSGRYNDLYPVYRQSYPAMQSMFQSLSRIDA